LNLFNNWKTEIPDKKLVSSLVFAFSNATCAAYVEGRLQEMHAAGAELHLPLLCRLITVAVDSLDALMEQKDLDELSESDEEVPQHASVHNYAHAALAVQVAGGGAAQQERSASHAGEKVNDAGGEKCGGGGKKHSVHGSSKGGNARGATLGDCAALAVLLLKETGSFPPYYLLHVRPGLLMAIFFFTQASVESYKLGLYLLWHVVGRCTLCILLTHLLPV
jgi:hypothetical protein